VVWVEWKRNAKKQLSFSFLQMGIVNSLANGFQQDSEAAPAVAQKANGKVYLKR